MKILEIKEMLKQIIKLKSKYSNYILIFIAFSITFSFIYYKEIDAQNFKNGKIMMLQR
jgi:hypothetical protein